MNNWIKTVVLIILILILGGGTFFYIKSKQNTAETNTTSTGFFKSFFSSKTTLTEDANTPTTEGDMPNSDTTNTNINNKTKLLKVTNFPIAGLATFVDTRPLPASAVPVNNTTPKVKSLDTPNVEYVSSLRYVGRNDGHVYGQYLDTGASAKVSSTTIPSIQEAYFGENNNTIIYRYLNDDNKKIQTFLTQIKGSRGEFLQENIQSVTISPDGNSMFYLVPIGDKIAGYYISFLDNKKVQTFTSAFTEWLPQWAGFTNIFLTTKPSWDTEGSLYVININKNNLVKILGGIKGLTTLVSNNGAKVLYSTTTKYGVDLNIYDITKNDSLKLPINTLADKCVWSKDGIKAYCANPTNISGNKYPDNWYKGLTSFDDKIVAIDTQNQSYSTIMEAGELESIDAINLTLSQDEKILFFINKKDYTLWRLDLE